jgi:hypothetical protein
VVPFKLADIGEGIKEVTSCDVRLMVRFADGCSAKVEVLGMVCQGRRQREAIRSTLCEVQSDKATVNEKKNPCKKKFQIVC